MSNPSVTAIISVDDKATPALKEMANLAKMIGAEMAKNLTGHGDGLAQSLNKANAAATEHIGRLTKMRNLYKEIGGLAAGIIGSKAIGMAERAIGEYLPVEKLNRKNNAIMGATPAEQKMLFDQQLKGAKVYGNSVLETAKGQGVFAARNYNPATVGAATDVALVAAKALGIDTAEGARLLETGTFTRGVDFNNPADARRELMNTANREAVANKRAAMDPEDIEMLAKFGFGNATAAGASQSTMWAIGMALKRAGIGGDQAGVFERSVFGKGLGGGPKADAVYASLGIDKGMFYKGGDSSPDALAKAISTSQTNKFGVKLSPEAQKILLDKMEAPESDVMSTKANLVKAVVDAMKEATGKDLNKNELKEVAASAGGQYELARKGFDGEKWFSYMLEHLSPSQAMAMFGTQQGGRFETLQGNKGVYHEYHDEQDKADGFADKMAQARMEGLGAAVDRLKNSIEAASDSVVKANENWLTPLTSGVAKVIGAFTELSDGMKEAIGIGVLTTAGGGIAALGVTAVKTVMSVNALAESAAVASVALQKIAATGSLPGGLPNSAVKEGVKDAEAVAAGAGGGMLSKAPTWLRATVGAGAAMLPWVGLGAAAGAGVYGISQIPDGTGGRFKHGTGRGVSVGHMVTQNDMLAQEPWGYSATFKPRTVPQGDSKWGDIKQTSHVEVAGTVTGSAELHNNMTITIAPSAYFESLVKSAQNIANMSVNGRLGTSMQGPGDNGTKPSQGALTGTQ